jgi:hypothetical protein
MKPTLNPIVEFFPIDDDEHSNLFYETKSLHQKELRKVLQNAQGIYAFYNSEAEIIYIGKTERQTLWQRMRNSYGQEKSNYTRYYVEHPHWKFKASKNGRVRKIVRRRVDLDQVAAYCSAFCSF